MGSADDDTVHRREIRAQAPSFVILAQGGTAARVDLPVGQVTGIGRPWATGGLWPGRVGSF